MREPLVIIPARYGSSRFPGKPLAWIKGADADNTEGVGAKRLIQRTWEVAQASGFRTVIATDDARIAEVAEAFGASVCITPDYLRNGTERCAYVAAMRGMRGEEVIVNLQGDACLTPPEWLTLIAERFDDRVATIVSGIPFDPTRGPGGEVIAYSNPFGEAYHFARWNGHPVEHALRHFGVYAYRVGALREYLAMGEESPLEAMVGLEQHRWMHLGIPLKLVWSPDDIVLPLCEVNERRDILRVEAELVRRGIR